MGKALKIVRKSDRAHQRIMSGLSREIYKPLIQNNDFLIYSVQEDGSTYKIIKRKSGQQRTYIYRFGGNPHTGKRTYFQRTLPTRESTKFSAVNNHVSFDLPLPTKHFARPQQKTQRRYYVPKTPNVGKREKGQRSVMNNQSASEHILQNIARSGFVTRLDRHEWCHLRAHNHGGAQHSENLVAGSRNSNSLQIGVEDALLYCSHALSSLSDMGLYADISCSVIPGTHIGLICKYSIGFMDSESVDHHLLNIYINMHFRSTRRSKDLQFHHVKVVFTRVSTRILGAAAIKLGLTPEDVVDEQDIEMSIRPLLDIDDA